MSEEHALRIGTIRGIPIKVEWTLLVIFWLLTWSLAASGLPTLAPGYGGAEYWLAAVATTALFFVSLLAHELSHSVVARSFGIEVHDITLWLLGGVSRIEGEATTPRRDFEIAIAGPAMSIACAIGSFIVAATFATIGMPALAVSCVVWLGSINLLLAAFNLAPAAPLDGGRVLRAWLWHRSGNRVQAAIRATQAGRVFGYVLVAAGFALFLGAADISGIWFVLLGWFLLSASRAEEVQVRLADELGGVRVGDLMTPHPITVPYDTTVERVLHDYVLTHHCSTFPVLDGHGALVGLVTLRRLRQVMPGNRATTPIGAVAVPLAHVTTAAPEERVLDVLRRAMHSADDRILVLRDGALVGIVSPSDVTRALQVAELARSR